MNNKTRNDKIMYIQCHKTFLGKYKIEFDQYIHECESTKEANEIYEWIKNNATDYTEYRSGFKGGGPSVWQTVIYTLKNPADITAFKLRWL